MTIYMTNDLHIDHYINHRVSPEDYIYCALKPADVFVLQGTHVTIQICSWNFTRRFLLVTKRFLLFLEIMI